MTRPDYFIGRLKTSTAPWQCRYCGAPVGYLGRFFAWVFGTRIHGCNFSNVRRTREGTDDPS